ncbi:MAG: DUF6701 domain-containing protein [Psychrobium sp.]
MNIKKLSVFILLTIFQLFVVLSVHADGTLVHEYTFANAWNSSTPVTDNVGNSNGAVVGQVSRVSNASFGGLSNSCYAADFTNGHIRLDNLNIDQHSDFNPEPTTITFWMRWEGNNNQMPFAWSRYDLWLRDNSFGFNHWQSNIYGISSNALDSQWVHVAAVFHNGDFFSNELYINGVKQSLTDRRNSSSSNGGQVLDTLSIGAHRVSANSDNYEFEGRIANFRIYRGVITENQVSQDMQNISGACGTSISGPTVEYRFDNFHNSTANSVLDSSGNDNHGTAFTASNAQGLLCTAADFSATGDANYIVANREALNGLSDFTAMAWIKTEQTHASTIFSAAKDNSSLGANEAVFYFDNANQFWPTITASPFNTSTRLGSTDNINDGQWHQVVWTRQAATRESCFFVDGIAQGCVTHNDGNDTSPISVANGGLVIGQEQDSLGGNFEVNQSFDGLMDEFMIFDYVMPQATIASIDSNIRSNKNWNGTTRAACSVAFPVVDMRFDENSWSGVNSVLDSSGNNYHGTPFGAAAPVNGMSCNALDLRATGINDYVSLSNQAIDGLQDFSVVFWGQQTDTNSMAAISGAGSNNNEMLFFIQRNGNSSNIRIRPYLKGNNFSINSTRDNQWHQFAWTRESSTRRSCIYRDGVLLGCNTHNSGNPLTISAGGFIIGQEQDSVGGGFAANQAWNGLIDELLIFPTVLTQTQIQVYRQNIIDGNDWRGLPKSCNDTVDHYRFEFSPSGLTCAASDVILKACEDASCSNEATESTSLNLSPTGQWTGSDVTNNNVSFTGNTNLALSQNVLGTVSIGASGLNPIPSNSIPVQCFNGTVSVNCEIAFKDTGFLFNTIPTQISGKPSNAEFNKKDLTIQAIAKNPTTGACENIFPANTDVDIQMKTNCASGTCVSASITKEGGGAAEQISNTYSNVTLRFGANSTAKYTYSYFHAGEMQLSARKQVTLPSGDVTTLEDVSNSFVIKPFGFKLTFAPDDEPHSGEVFKRAGQPFSVNAVAIAWQPGEDGNPSDPATHDGNIDSDESPDGNFLVSNFEGELVQLKHQLLLPTPAQGGVVGDFSATDRNLTDSTASFNDATWSEVGEITLIADLEDGDYRGAGNVVGVDDIGRFIPDHFTISDLVEGDLTGQCVAQTFIGETTADGGDTDSVVDGALRYYAINPAMRINAMHSDGTSVLQNYRGSYMRLEPDDVIFDPTTNGVSNSVAVSGVIEVGNLNESNGVVTYTMSDTDNFVFTRNIAAQVAPFGAILNFPIQTIEDTDGVLLKTSTAQLSAISTAGHQVVYGRVKLYNAFGPDNQALAMPVEHQMYNGSEFVTNTVIGAGCSYPVTPSSDFSLTPSTFGDLTATSLTTPLTWLSGKASLQLPASNLSGTLQLELDVPAWLRFDWDNNAGSADTNPRATAVFGRYRGNDRIINWRERR